LEGGRERRGGKREREKGGEKKDVKIIMNTVL